MTASSRGSRQKLLYAKAEAELTEARAYRQRVMEKAALDALIRHYQEAEGAAGSSH